MKLFESWQRVAKLPGSKYLWWRLLRKEVPYSSTIKAEVDRWEPGNIKLRMKDRRSVRNHLNSIHAVALMNLCELTSGLGLLSSIPDTVKGIPIRFSIDFKKKARGELTAEARVVPPEVKERVQFVLNVDVKDASQTIVCSAEVLWVLQPVT